MVGTDINSCKMNDVLYDGVAKVVVFVMSIFLVSNVYLLHTTSPETERGSRLTPDRLEYDLFVVNQHNRTNPAHFPYKINADNCFFKPAPQSYLLPECGFDIRSCNQSEDAKHFIPDFDLDSWLQRERKYPTMLSGSWAPCECQPETTLAIIIPFRDRTFHLNAFINNIIPFLQFQRQAFTIFVIEHTGKVAFNRGASFNAAYRIIQNLHHKYDCYIVHDVDMVNENLCNYYQCGVSPRLLSVLVEKKNYRLYYRTYAGGVVAMSRDIVEQINGMSNLFFGWGGEDDNLYWRFIHTNYLLQRYEWIGRYSTLEHRQSKSLVRRTISDSRDLSIFHNEDGHRNLCFKLLNITKNPLFVYISVHIPGPNNTKISVDAHYRQSIVTLQKDFPDKFTEWQVLRSHGKRRFTAKTYKSLFSKHFGFKLKYKF